MAITYVSSGAIVYTTGNPSPVTPTHNVGDMLILTIGTKPDTAAATAPTGWTPMGAVSGGTGSAGNDTGPMRVGVFYRIADGTGLDTTGSISIPSNNVTSAQVHVFRRSAGIDWEIAGVGAADTTANTSHTVTMPSNPGLIPNDMLFAIGVIPTDIGAGNQFSAQTVSAAGMTTVSLTEINEWTTASGQDMGAWLARGTVVTGTSTGNPTVTATASGTVTNVTGPIFLVRLREFSPVIKTASDGAAISVSDTSSKQEVTETSRIRPAIVGVVASSFAGTTASGVQFANFSGSVLAGDLVVAITSASSMDAVLGPVSSSGYMTLNNIAVAGVGPQSGLFVGVAPSDATNPQFSMNYSNALNINRGFVVLVIRYHGGVGVPANGGGMSSPSIVADTTDSRSLVLAQFVDGVSAAAQNSAVLSTVQGVPGVLQSAFGTATYNMLIGAWSDIPSPGTNTYAYTGSTSGSTTYTNQALEIKPQVTYAPVVSATPISASDSASITVTDSTSPLTVNNNVVATESGSVSIAETSALFKTISTSDAASITIADSSASFRTMSASDGAAVGVAEVTAIAGQTTYLDVSDTASITVSDASTLFRQMVATDGADVSVAESNSIFKQVSANDTTALTLTESISTLDRFLPGQEPNSLAVSETTSIFVTTSANDTPTVGLADSGTNTVSFSSSDTSALTFSEEVGMVTFNSIVANDGGSLLTTESTSTAVGVVTNDAAAISVSESNTRFVTQTAADTGGIGVSESRAQFITQVASDSGSISSSETVAQVRSIGTTDTAAVSVSETSVLNRFIFATDTSSVAASDSSALLQDATLPGNETTFVMVSEDVQIFITQVASDSSSVAVGESRAVAATVSSNDGLMMVVSDSGSNTSFNLISTSDTSAVSVSESRSQSASISTSDTTSVSVADSSVSFRTFLVGDVASVATSEIAGNYVTTSATESISLGVDDFEGGAKDIPDDDTSALAVSESATLVKAVIASDSTAWSITETSKYDKNLPGTDTTALGVAEQAGMFITQTSNDVTAISVNDIKAVKVFASSADISAMSFTEPTQLFMTKSASDTILLSVGEISDTEGLSDEQASDSLVVTLGELAQNTVYVSTSDTSSLSVVESSYGFITKSSSETAAIGVNDNRTLLVQPFGHTGRQADGEPVVTESLAIGLTETASVMSVVTANDAATISISDASAMSTTVSSSEEIKLHVEEAVGNFKSYPGTDHLMLSVGEQGDVAIGFNPRHDAAAIGVQESSSVRVPIYAVDGGSVGVVESGDAVGRETDAVLPLVYLNGQWRTGTIVIYRKGQWHRINAYAYSNGKWHSTEE